MRIEFHPVPFTRWYSLQGEGLTENKDEVNFTEDTECFLEIYKKYIKLLWHVVYQSSGIQLFA